MDLNDNLDLVKLGAVTLADYDYDLLDRRVLKSLGVSPVQQTSYSYDLAGQLVDLHHQLLPSTNIAQYEYPQYDLAGNRKEKLTSS